MFELPYTVKFKRNISILMVITKREYDLELCIMHLYIQRFLVNSERIARVFTYVKREFCSIIIIGELQSFVQCCRYFINDIIATVIKYPYTFSNKKDINLPRRRRCSVGWLCIIYFQISYLVN